ncbi:MAG: STAS domain-containing protein [Bacilli bacterium]|nr:STAS domain-containing protein [Bacilli bacterium]
MLLIDKEFHKGILFVRLKGSLTKDMIATLNKEVTKMVADMEIRNVVFNINDITEIDITGVNAILYNYNLCRDNNGISMLCGGNTKIKDYINHSSISSMFQIKDEMSAMKMIEI